MIMSKRNCYYVEDKMCLLQILSMLNNLEALSQDYEISGSNNCIGVDFVSLYIFKFHIIKITIKYECKIILDTKI